MFNSLSKFWWHKEKKRIKHFFSLITKKVLRNDKGESLDVSFQTTKIQVEEKIFHFPIDLVWKKNLADHVQ